MLAGDEVPIGHGVGKFAPPEADRPRGGGAEGTIFAWARSCTGHPPRRAAGAVAGIAMGLPAVLTSLAGPLALSLVL